MSLENFPGHGFSALLEAEILAARMAGRKIIVEWLDNKKGICRNTRDFSSLAYTYVYMYRCHRLPHNTWQRNFKVFLPNVIRDWKCSICHSLFLSFQFPTNESCVFERVHCFLTENQKTSGKQEGAEEPDGEQGEAVVNNEECSDSNLPELTITTVESLAPSSPIPEAPKEEETVTISIRKRRLNCHICGLSLKDRSHLYQHYSQKHYKTMLVKHIDQQDLKCHECGKQFSTFNVLVLHLGTVHNILGRKTPL